ncbi:DUF1540 domain-containing protein [Corynebacterium tapiri]|uniref:DUF1540 domain-containing protein n=1 Tax=Corynebacterium tapiri TaxID=1448266 RepID=A0A5C4U3E3_9CORY|nr:DUF1540 domain-containing protein [Corynebacterium tapiri]TNL95688.1 DUF1540 domain-containing protein [Corynebacterium tapiri]
MSLATVSTCSATTCAFNQNGCTAPAITMNEGATCATFATLDVRAKGEGEGAVGVCHRLECVHNDALSCTASGVDVTAAAACDTFEAR